MFSTWKVQCIQNCLFQLGSTTGYVRNPMNLQTVSKFKYTKYSFSFENPNTDFVCNLGAIAFNSENNTAFKMHFALIVKVQKIQSFCLYIWKVGWNNSECNKWKTSHIKAGKASHWKKNDCIQQKSTESCRRVLKSGFSMFFLYLLSFTYSLTYVNFGSRKKNV